MTAGYPRCTLERKK